MFGLFAKKINKIEVIVENNVASAIKQLRDHESEFSFVIFSYNGEGYLLAHGCENGTICSKNGPMTYEQIERLYKDQLKAAGLTKLNVISCHCGMAKEITVNGVTVAPVFNAKRCVKCTVNYFEEGKSVVSFFEVSK